mmetsp:Transcript_136512/g.323311  ORF Transcript_136512/g.323311 Transcript_136512/m.323311 type:complete len:347 (-) Transcript_136512:107-1147(-)|eukprot:CAMPEP_0181447520 /NCGR_PEP_ID=MMETSP1110-20121109/26665_1 /TAXON_ID=174948 /ORGANISM="Symbiodinium sp., Strain CCMP421" /LENGTH=346 /DNA_ID=CAMNT_0023571637 /DNA_START=71 /DNA_END=1111 /DNA_ORIENTATION=-
MGSYTSGCSADCENCTTCTRHGCGHLCLIQREKEQKAVMKTFTVNATAADDNVSPELQRYAVHGSEDQPSQNVCFGIVQGEEVLFEEASRKGGSHEDEVLRSLPRQPRGTDQPNVGHRCNIHTLEEECRFNPGKLEKIRRLAQVYSDWRSVRGDGNCYYRTVIFGALEALMASQDHQRLNQVMIALRQVHYDCVAEQKCHNQMLQIMRSWRCPDQIEQWVAQDATLDQALIRACRRLVRQFLMKRADEKSPSGLTYNQLVKALDSQYAGMEDFCRHVVDPLGRDAETLALDALPQQLGIGLRMWILDRRDEVSLVSLDTPGPQNEVDVHILFKPGHYDLLYPGIQN